MSARACHNGAAGGRACQSQHRRAGLALAVDFGRSCQRRNSCAFPDILRADEPLLNGRYERWVEECKGASGDLLAYVRQARTHRSRCWGIYKTALSIVMALEQSIQAGTLDLKTTRELADLFASFKHNRARQTNGAGEGGVRRSLLQLESASQLMI